MPKEYTCDNCKGTFYEGWSEEEALKEAEENFGKPVSEWKDDVCIVCDDCFQTMNPKDYPEEVERAKKFN